MRISDWSSDVCSAELTCLQGADGDNVDALVEAALTQLLRLQAIACPPGLPAYDRTLLMRELGLFREWFLQRHLGVALDADEDAALAGIESLLVDAALAQPQVLVHRDFMLRNLMPVADGPAVLDFPDRSEEHTSELQSLMRISYAVFCLKKQN